MLWGAAGVGFVLLDLGIPVMGDGAVALATRAGDYLLSVAQECDLVARHQGDL